MQGSDEAEAGADGSSSSQNPGSSWTAAVAPDEVDINDYSGWSLYTDGVMQQQAAIEADEMLPFFGGWSCYRDDEVMQQQAAIEAEEALKLPLVGGKEPLSTLAAEYQFGSSILQEKIMILSEEYNSIRRTRGDGNCFFRAFMFSYLEHILETQDKAEVDRVLANVDQCKKTLQSLGYSDFTFEDFFALFIEQLECVLQGNETLLSPEELLERSRDPWTSDYVVMFFRFVTSSEIRKRAEFYAPFILGLTDGTVDQFCKISVEPMGAESDHVHIIALSDALGVPIRVVYLDRSSGNSSAPNINHHDFIPSPSDQENVNAEESGTKPFITLLYRLGHYDILYSNSK